MTRIGPASNLRLASSARLEWDAQREHWVVQAPERLFYPDEIGLAVLRRCDGRRTLAEIARELAGEYQASTEEITRDLLDFLQDLADKGVVIDGAA